MSGYTPLFNEIVTSSIWNEDNAVRIVWISLMALSDADGDVQASIAGLAPVARVSFTECEKAIMILSSPDKYSRSQEKEGRRIEAIDGGWHIINHRKYRQKAQSRAEYFRKWRQEKKKNQKEKNTLNANSNSATQCNVAQHSATVAHLKDIFDQARKKYPGVKRGLNTEFEYLKKCHKDWKDIINLILPAIENQIEWRKHLPKDRIPPWKNFKTWLYNRCWEDELPTSSQPNIKQIKQGPSPLELIKAGRAKEMRNAKSEIA